MANPRTYSAGDSTAGSATAPQFVVGALAATAGPLSAFVDAALASATKVKPEDAYEELHRSLRPKRPKYDPHNARAMWNTDVLSAAARPGKRPSHLVIHNQVPRSIRPQRRGRKR